MRTITAPRSNRPAPQPIAISAMRTTKKATPAPTKKATPAPTKKATPAPTKKTAPAPTKKTAPKVEVKRQNKEDAKKTAPKTEPKPAPLPLSPEEMVMLYRHLDKVLANVKGEVMELPDLFLQIPLSLRNRPETATFRKFFSTLVGLGFVINPHAEKAAKKAAPAPAPAAKKAASASAPAPAAKKVAPAAKKVAPAAKKVAPAAKKAARK